MMKFVIRSIKIGGIYQIQILMILKGLEKKLNIDVSIVRDCLGIKDYYDFELDQDEKVKK
jgi:hypothetical protein